jgi:hypothetical protein
MFLPDGSDWFWCPPPELLKLANHIHLALRLKHRTAFLLPSYDLMAYTGTTFKHDTYMSITVLRFSPHKIGQ